MKSTTHGVGIVDAGETYVISRPKNHVPPGTKMGVVFLHGAGSNALDSLTYPGVAPTLTALATHGHATVSVDASGGNWSNDMAMSKISTARNHLITNLGAKNGKIVLIGVSMGGGNSLTWAARNPTMAAAVMGIIPVVDLTDMVDNNRQGVAASINSVYSPGWAENIHGPTHNPLTMAKAGKFAGISVRTYYGLYDPICVPSAQVAFAEASGATAVPFAGPHGILAGDLPWIPEEVAEWVSSL